MTEPVEEAQRLDRRTAVYHLTKTDPDPRVRRRAQAVLLVEDGHSQASVARLLHTSAYRVHVWQERCATEGRMGLVDRPRGGRPHTLTLSPDDRALLEEALDRGPQAYGAPMTIWSIRDLQALLQRERGVEASVYTVHRAVHALGFRYRRPRHDLTHRQDAQAVAVAGRVLDWLPKNQLLSPEDSIWSTWMSAKSTPIPTWQRSGGARGSR
jgi:transposase